MAFKIIVEMENPLVGLEIKLFLGDNLGDKSPFRIKTQNFGTLNFETNTIIFSLYLQHNQDKVNGTFKILWTSQSLPLKESNKSRHPCSSKMPSQTPPPLDSSFLMVILSKLLLLWSLVN